MFENNKILILGFARSGYNAAKFLIKRGNEVILNDSKTEDKLDKSQINELTEMGVKLVFGSHPDDLLDDSFDYLIKNPGVPIDHKYVLKARELGVEVINEAEMAFRLLPEGVNLISITGTNGKTTTTTLTYEIMYKNRTVRDMIRDKKIDEISAYLNTEEAMKEGMCSMDTTIKELYKKGTITRDTALDFAFDRRQMSREI